MLALPLSMVVVAINVLMSRLLTPRSVALVIDGEKTEKYLNLNLAYELWSDIKFTFVLVLEDKLPYLFRLMVGWGIFNSIVFIIIYSVSYRTFGPAWPC